MQTCVFISCGYDRHACHLHQLLASSAPAPSPPPPAAGGLRAAVLLPNLAAHFSCTLCPHCLPHPGARGRPPWGPLQSSPFFRIVVYCCLVAESCLALCNPMDCSTPGFPVRRHLPELLKLMSIESVMPSNHLILCCPLLLLPSIFPSIRVFFFFFLKEFTSCSFVFIQN